MNGHYLYLTIDLLTILFPLVFSFYPKANFSKQWKYLWPSILIPGVVFIVWDELFTRMGIWEFNPAYVSGIHVGSLPVEEVLFFICVPYACVFTYEAINYLIEKDILRRSRKVISITIILVSLVMTIAHIDKWYTATTFLSLAVLLSFLQLSGYGHFLGRFYLAYVVLLVPFFFVNGVLTGSWISGAVVLYNDAENLGVRIGTIPLEDAAYAMVLMLMNVGVFEWGRTQRKIVLQEWRH